MVTLEGAARRPSRSPLSRLRIAAHQLYAGRSPHSRHFLYGLLLFDLVTLLFIIAVPFYPKASVKAEIWFWYYSPYVRVFEFLCGVFAAAAFLRSPPLSRIVCVSIELAAMTWLLAATTLYWLGYDYFGKLLYNFQYVPAIAPIIFCCASPHSLLARVLQTRPLIFAGMISYSVYILQMDILPLSRQMGPPVAQMISIFVFTTLAAYGSYLLIEAPARKAIRSALSPEPPQPLSRQLPSGSQAEAA